MTQEQIKRHEKSGEEFHVPAIVHRSGGVSAQELNTCRICGAQIVPSLRNPSLWLDWREVTDEEADAIRLKAKARR